MNKTAVLVAVLCAAAESASAQSWFWEEAQGVRSAGVEYDNSVLAVDCVTTALNVPSSIHLSLDGERATGEVAFDFGDGNVVLAPFAEGSLRAVDAVSISTFVQIVSSLKESETVEVFHPSGSFGTFSLSGSRLAIGDCKLTTGAVGDPTDGEKLAVSNQPIVAPQLQLTKDSARGTSSIVPYGPSSSVPFFTVANCPASRAVGVYIYSGFATPVGVPDSIAGTMHHELSEVCFDADRGQVAAREDLNDLTLVEQGPKYQRFEVIDDAVSAPLRTWINIGQHEVLGEAFFAKEMPARFRIENPGGHSKPRSVDGSSKGYSFMGFVVDDMTPPDPPTATYSVAMLGWDNGGWETRYDSGRLVGQFLSVTLLEGNLVVSKNEGLATLEVNRERSAEIGAPAAAGGGQLAFKVSENGAVTADGKLEFKNARLAGMSPADWERTEWHLIQFEGATLGLSGANISGVGIIRGTTTNLDGTRTRVFGYTTLQGTRVN
ncbi:MAG: hypothetical protein AAGA71_19620 [Pseudomonadota bacterium]